MKKRTSASAHSRRAARRSGATAFAAHSRASEPLGTPAMPPASSFSARVDNQWFPLLPGTRYVYTGVKDGKPSRDVLTVTHETKTIDGVPCVVAHERLYLRGRPGERTTDWYSQDEKGNVWYFGENTAELDAHGHVTSTAGTWTAGLDGAQPGIYMPAHPRVGQSGRQEAGAAKSAQLLRTVATGCHRLLPSKHGKAGVDGSSPSEGLHEMRANMHLLSPVHATRGFTATTSS
jgi:hypothetical protein